MPRIFITGGTGFFGKSLLFHCRALRECEIVMLSPEPARVVDELPLSQCCKSLHLWAGDVRDFTFPDCNFDYILHAATTSSKILPDEETRSVVVDGTKRVIEFARLNRRLANFLYVSSGAVYGDRYQVPMKESFSCEPVTVYGKSKLQAERLCLNSGLPCSIARCFAFVGEFLPLDAHFAIGNFISDCLHDRPITIKGDGTATRTYLYAGDLSNWLWTILWHGQSGQVYNVGSDREVSIYELAEIVKQIAGTGNEIKLLTPPLGKMPQRYVPDITRALCELNLRPETSLEDAIKLTLQYHRSCSH